MMTARMLLIVVFLSTACHREPKEPAPQAKPTRARKQTVQLALESEVPERKSGRNLSAVEMEKIRERQAGRNAVMKRICKAHNLKIGPKCETELFRDSRVCEKDADCVPVIDECGHWVPINKKFSAEFQDMQTDMYVGTTPCRWRGPSATAGNKPKFACQAGTCANHLSEGGIKIIDPKPNKN